MSIKKIIIGSVLAIVSFGATFTVGLFVNKPKPPVVVAEDQKIENIADASTGRRDSDVAVVTENPVRGMKSELHKTLTEKQVKNLIHDIQAKMKEYKTNDNDLTLKEERIKVAMKDLRDNIKDLDQLRIQLTDTVLALKREKQELEKSIVKISKLEKANIVKTATIYDKMKPTSSGPIMINMSVSNQMNYVVKILYYMQTRTSANMLAEIGRKEPALAAMLSDKLRLIEEE
jgi:flagellar motility protein MotE (MotC chaperone)